MCVFLAVGGGDCSPRNADLEAAGITKIYSPEDGQRLGFKRNNWSHALPFRL